MNAPSQTVPLAGYSDKLSVRPGETISFKVSSTGDQPFAARLARSIGADPNPAGIGIVEEALDDVFPCREVPSRVQPFFLGSYAISDSDLTVDGDAPLLLSALIWPGLHKPGRQAILSIGDISLYIDGDGAAALSVGGQRVSTSVRLDLRRWYRIDGIVDFAAGRTTVAQCPAGLSTDRQACVMGTDALVRQAVVPEGRVMVAARLEGGLATDHFNGKIEAPSVHRGERIDAAETLVRWDFSDGIPTTRVTDTGPSGLHGRLVNYPARGMTGASWDGREMCWRHAPGQYGAIHFHEDDIYDFGWETDFTFTIPDDMPSGIYVMRTQCGEHEDAMPFYVCPPLGQARAKLCFLVPTFTYAIYGNHARPDYKPSWQDRIRDWDAYPHNPAVYPHYGLSTYNFHPDGSGICHASHLRPLFNLRPGYSTFGASACSGLRHFQADSHLISWLHVKGIDYDVITDRELHEDGVAALSGYQAVMTASHPEYHTRETLDALLAYRDGGGNLLYLGGNGFYWRIALHSEETGILEIRRAEDGIRAWAAEPGEYYNAFDGEYGGLWRRNGRPPQQLAGVGFSAQGQFNGSYYRRKCYDPDYDWIFKDVEGDILGDFGFCGGGAAGFELDRVDYRLGSPDNIVVLASSEGHGDDFVLVPEEQLTHITTWPGELAKDLLRADMVYFETPGGGRVFSVGSITFCGSLPWNDFDNDISTLLSNVVRRLIV